VVNDLRPKSERLWARAILIVLVGILVTGVLAAVGPAGVLAQSATHVDEGDIQASNPATIGTTGVTESEFSDSCEHPPSSQGTDGWVFKLPADVVLPAPAKVTGSSTAPYDLNAYFYTAECVYMEGENDLNMATAAADEEGTISEGAAYVVVNAAIGAEIHVVLCAGDLSGCPAPDASPTPTATAEPSAAPSGAPSPSPSESEGNTERHPRTIGLRFSHRDGRLAASGRVRVVDDYQECRDNVPVKLQVRRDRWVTLRSGKTDSDGRYRFLVKDRERTFRAKARPVSRPADGVDHVCEVAMRVKTHDHGGRTAPP